MSDATLDAAPRGAPHGAALRGSSEERLQGSARGILEDLALLVEAGPSRDQKG